VFASTPPIRGGQSGQSHTRIHEGDGVAPARSPGISVVGPLCSQWATQDLLPPGADDLLFPSLAPRRRDEGKREFNGRPLLRKLIASGVRDLGLHACHHTVASWLKKEGGHSVWEIGEVLNHSLSGSVTSGYIHTSSPA
jgi:integrase